MQNSESSRNLHDRLSVGKDSVRAQQRFGSESDYVQHIRAYVADCPNSGSQQQRLRYGNENWLLSQYRWIVEHRAYGTDWAKLRRVAQACLDELDVMAELEAVAGTIGPEYFVDLARQEGAAGYYEDSATLDAMHHKTPGTYRRVADYCNAQIEALRQKGRYARLLAVRLTHRGA